jgi:hypothetical protein
VGAKTVKRWLAGRALAIAAAFLAGFLTHSLYLRWRWPLSTFPATAINKGSESSQSLIESRNHPVTYRPSEAFEQKTGEPPTLQARDIERIRGLIGQRARIRGRIFRVGYSAKSNTYFLNFGPTREALTGIIFASAVELFETSKLLPKSFEGKEVEIEGEIKDHPQYGLEMILENPAQIKVVQ